MRTGRGAGRVTFSRRKYGPELLIDAAMLSALPAFNAIREPHRLEFYDILLITRGQGWFDLDDERYRVAPGELFVTRPGQVRRWDVAAVDGACVFFASEFIRDAFADARFLDQFAIFDPARRSGAITLSASERTQFLRRFRRMSEELRALRSDATELLRARLYELLVLMNRWYLARHPKATPPGRNSVVDRFRSLVEREFRRLHRVQDYAERLGVSPGHLNVLCHAHLARPASAEIHQRLLLEARRLLRYTDKPAFAIAQELGFADPAYFGRFFKREAGVTPRGFRVRK
ncbi:MAG TPA: helix-turn-helix domain-containing protein [Vicinamibacterales bacterium]